MSEKSTRRGSAPPEPAVGLTDLDRIAALSDAAIALDPEAAPVDVDWSRAEVVIPPRKVPVSIRLDADILDHFRREGAGYQSRINAVLRGYIRARTERD